MRNISDLQIQARAPHPITLRLSGTFYVIAGIFTAMDVAYAVFVLPSEPISGSLMVIGISFVLFFGFRAMRNGATFLAIDLEGITQSHNFHSESARWSEIRNIQIGWYIRDLADIPWNRQIFISYEEDGQKKEKWQLPALYSVQMSSNCSVFSRHFMSLPRSVNYQLPCPRRTCRNGAEICLNQQFKRASSKSVHIRKLLRAAGAQRHRTGAATPHKTPILLPIVFPDTISGNMELPWMLKSKLSAPTARG
jgi:hypothetical protein